MPPTASALEREFQLLMARSPYEAVNGTVVDKVQNEVLAYFNAAAQYHMDPGLRERFIAQQPPDVPADLRPIISNKDAGDFYRGLSVPYVAMTLKNSKDPAVKRLNVTRAERRVGESMRSSKVYRSQAQQMYALAWEKKFPGTATLKDDQRQNSRTYKEKAEAALEAFLAEECDKDDPNTADIVRGILKKYLVDAQNGKYWAFRALLACLSNRNLGTLAPTSDRSSAITDPTSPSHKMMRQCSILNALDDSGKYATFLQDMVLHRTYAVALPEMIDGKGNEKELSVICTEILEAFVKQPDFLDSKYQQLRDGVSALLAIEDGQRVIDRYFTVFFAAMTSGGTSRSLGGWLKTHIQTADLRNIGAVHKHGPKVALSAANMGRIIAQGMAIAGIAMIMSNGISWGQMTNKERAATVVAGLDLFLVAAPKVLSLGVVTIPDTWTCLTTWLKSRSTVATTLTRNMGGIELQSLERLAARSRNLSSTAVLRSESAGLQVESGLRKWLTGSMEGTIASTTRAMAATAQAGEVTVVQRIFGPNLDYFMARRVAPLMALAAVGFGVYFAYTARDEKERWLNVALAGAAAMEFISITTGIWGAAGWIGRIGSFLGPIGMVISIAAVGYMIYDSFTQSPPPSIIAQFVENEAKLAKLYMRYEMDIDYLSSIGSLSLGNGITVTSETGEYLQLDLENAPCAIRKNRAQTDFDADTVFDMEVNGDGQVKLISSGYSADPDPYTGAAERKRQSTVLMVSADGKVIAGSMTAAEADADATLWESEMLKPGTKNNGTPQSGEFSLKNKKTQKYLAVENGAVTVRDTAYRWTVTTGVPMRKRFTYSVRRFDETTSEIPVDEDQAGAKEITWTGQNLPKFISLASDGALKIDEDKMDADDKVKTHRFTVTASNPGGSFSARVDLRYVDDGA